MNVIGWVYLLMLSQVSSWEKRLLHSLNQYPTIMRDSPSFDMW